MREGCEALREREREDVGSRGRRPEMRREGPVSSSLNFVMLFCQQDVEPGIPVQDH